ncbi:unnamed protein product [Protopolystoma xenopodis]|uniref:Malate dehydrogenase n=1 Tax=Protopolystoma xenopodis TaxID=117903 RepID=A0A448XHR4_9PLAT|nr:unnamed protein product [Protopolystoma xenopodis]
MIAILRFWHCKGAQGEARSQINYRIASNEKDDVQNFCTKCITSVGGKPSHAEQLANLLVAADYRGHYSHGLNRIEMYVIDIEKGICAVNKEPAILKETHSTSFVEGNNVLGPVVGNFCMNIAIEKAKKTGVSWVAAKGSNHFGIAGWYSMMASAQGLLVSKTFKVTKKSIVI